MPYANIVEVMGRTPLVALRRVIDGCPPRVYAKLENLNPGGNLKDRIAVAMIEDAERRGALKPGWTIIEPTSGNTGISLAIVAAVKGYRCIATVPDKASSEKLQLLQTLGAEVVLCPSEAPRDSPKNYYEVAERLHREIPNSFLPDQYSNKMNPEAHYRTTGPEIWDDTEGSVTHFVCGMGTGGTISGVGRFLKEKNPEVRVVGVDAFGSVLANRFYGQQAETPESWELEGIGCTIIPGTLHFEYIDEIVRVEDRDAFRYARRLAREEGLVVGGSSGAVTAAAVRMARDLSEDSVVVVLFADTGERYLSKVHSETWLRDHGFMDGPPPGPL